jgi:calcineurin-like phosphoesterase family protein
MKSTALALALLVMASCTDEDPVPAVDAGVPADATVAPDLGAAPDGAALADGGGDAAADDGTFTVIVLPDTQFYAQVYPQYFDMQTQWIVAQKDALKIAFVLHEGDIVNDEIKVQWENAARSLHKLDMQVPYVLAAGNHDIINADRDAPLMNQYFPVSTFMAQPWFKGTFEPNKIQNNYQIFPVGGRMWLVMALEFGPRDEVLAWAAETLARHSTLPAIIVTHAYMYLNDERYDHVKYPPSSMHQYWGPHDYELSGSSNDGEEMWQKLVSKASNVQFVVSGHVPYPYSVSRLRSQRPDGTHVHQLLANFQGCFNESPKCVDMTGMRTMGGWGYLRIMRFDPANHRVRVQTYSPVRDHYLRDAANEFELDLD